MIKDKFLTTPLIVRKSFIIKISAKVEKIPSHAILTLAESHQIKYKSNKLSLITLMFHR